LLVRGEQRSAVVWRLLLPGRFDLGERHRLGLNAQCATGSLCYELGYRFPQALDRGSATAIPEISSPELRRIRKLEG